MRTFWMIALLALAGPSLAQPAVTAEPVEYSSGDTLLKGYLARPEGSTTQRPGVLVVHEWWGHNDYARKRARMLAELGYTALAVDMYGDGKTADHPEDAGKFAAEAKQNMAVAEARFRAALELLRAQPDVDPGRIAAIGYCFGGGIVLDMARRGVDLKGVVSFHGVLASGQQAEPGQVKARVLVFNGAEDPFTKPEQIAAFKAEMEAAGVDYQFVNLPGAKHSFTNPQADSFGQKFHLPLEYNAQADERSWRGMREFFTLIFEE